MTRPPHRRRAATALALGLAAAGGSAARAQPVAPDLTREYQAGIDAYRLGKYDEARAHLEAARDLEPKLPGPHRFLGAVAQAQGRWPACIAETRAALELNPQSTEADDTRRLHDECRASAGRAPFRGDYGTGGAIAVVTNVPGATVKIGGLAYGGTPLAPRPIALGEREVTVEKPGWRPATATAVILPGLVTDVDLDLEPDPSARGDAVVQASVPPPMTTGVLVVEGPAAVAPGAAVTVDGAALALVDGAASLAPGVHVVEVRAPGRAPWRRRVRVAVAQRTRIAPALEPAGARAGRRTLGQGLLAGGGALLAAGFAAAVVRADAVAEARDIYRVETTRPVGVDTTATAPLRTRADLEAAAARARRWGAVSTAAFGAAGVALVAAAAFTYLGAGERADAPPPFALAPSGDGRGAVVSLSRAVAW